MSGPNSIKYICNDRLQCVDRSRSKALLSAYHYQVVLTNVVYPDKDRYKAFTRTRTTRTRGRA